MDRFLADSLLVAITRRLAAWISPSPHVAAFATAHGSIVRFLCSRSRLLVTGNGFFSAEGCGKRLCGRKTWQREAPAK